LRKFGFEAAAVRKLERQNPHPSTSLRAGFLAKDARNRAPGAVVVTECLTWARTRRLAGMLRLRREDRFAILPAALSMTGFLTQH
jgi:hypothetical protein